MKGMMVNSLAATWNPIRQIKVSTPPFNSFLHDVNKLMIRPTGKKMNAIISDVLVKPLLKLSCVPNKWPMIINNRNPRLNNPVALATYNKYLLVWLIIIVLIESDVYLIPSILVNKKFTKQTVVEHHKISKLNNLSIINNLRRIWLSSG